MKVLKRIVIVLLAIIVLLVIISFFLPSISSIQNSKLINTPANSIFEEVNNLKKWNKWSPWEKADTTMVTSFEGPEKGVGAIMKWTSEMGDGQMTIIESIDNKQLRNKLEFTRGGMETKGLWLFEETEEGTNITWTFTGDVGFNPIAKYMMMFMRKEIDNSQKQGLESLKEICEAKP